MHCFVSSVSKSILFGALMGLGTLLCAQIPTNTANIACVNTLLEEDFTADIPTGWVGDFVVSPDPLSEGWILQSGPSPDAPSTGADGAASGQYYVYLETNGPAPTMSTYTITTPEIQVTGANPSLRFNVLMNGSDIGQLRVDVLSGPGFATTETVLTLVGAQHTSSAVSNWTEAFIDLSQFEGQAIMIAFEGMKLTTNQGDIAIDLVQVCSEVGIPTMGEWGIICLGLLFLIVGIVALSSRRIVMA